MLFEKTRGPSSRLLVFSFPTAQMMLLMGVWEHRAVQECVGTEGLGAESAPGLSVLDLHGGLPGRSEDRHASLFSAYEPDVAQWQSMQRSMTKMEHVEALPSSFVRLMVLSWSTSVVATQ